MNKAIERLENAKKYTLKAYKGFDPDMTCRGFKFAEGGEYEEDKAELCASGFHACELPHEVFGYYAPGKSVYHEVELGDVQEEKDGSKRVGKRIKIGARVDLWHLVEISVSAFFEWFGFDKKIKGIEDTGDASALMAGDASALKAGDASALMAWHNSALKAGHNSALKAGDGSALEAGYASALEAGDDSALKAGPCSVVYGGHGSKVSGGLYSVLAIQIRNEENKITGIAHEVVDGERIKADTFYELVDGKFTEVLESGDVS
jgi:hypothetical protein